MIAQECIFCKIIARELPAKVVVENDETIVIQDVAPKAPVHYLIISKKHISDVMVLEKTDAPLVAKMFLMAKHVAEKLSGSQAFRLIINNGRDAGQSVFHLHFHFLSGKKMLDF